MTFKKINVHKRMQTFKIPNQSYKNIFIFLVVIGFSSIRSSINQGNENFNSCKGKLSIQRFPSHKLLYILPIYNGFSTNRCVSESILDIGSLTSSL